MTHLLRHILLPFIIMAVATVSATNVEVSTEDIDLVVETADYIVKNKPDQAKTDSLLNTIPLFTLDDALRSAGSAFTPKNAAKVTDAIFMIANMKQGHSLEEARDAISFTIFFPFRRPNHLDFQKLNAVFMSNNATLHSAYMSKLPFVLRNCGAMKELLDLRRLILNNVADSEEKAKTLALLDSYAPLADGCQAPDVTLTDSDGNTHRLKDYLGKTVVIDVWASWCSNCMKKMPEFLSIRDSYAKHKDDIVFLTVSIDRKKDRAKWLNFSEKMTLNGPTNLWVDNEAMSEFEDAYKVYGVPRYIVIGADGNFVDAFAPSPGGDLAHLLSTCTMAGGINFEDITLAQALEKAGQENKFVFVDCYITSCGPCKYMADKIFPLKICGDYINPQFISLKKNLDYDENKSIAKDYGVMIFPTFLILNPDGTVYYKQEGGGTRSADTFISRMHKVMKMGDCNRRYNAGERDRDFMIDYISELNGFNNVSLRILLESYVPSLNCDQLADTVLLGTILQNISSTDSPAFRHLFDMRSDISTRIGGELFGKMMLDAYSREYIHKKSLLRNLGKRAADIRQLESEGIVTPALLSNMSSKNQEAISQIISAP